MAVDYVSKKNDDGSVLFQSGEKGGFYGATPVAVQATADAGTDAETTQALANALKLALDNLGLTA